MAAIKKNLEVFELKFKMQQRELAEEMRRMVHHEGDRVIEAVTAGPHDRIIDPVRFALSFGSAYLTPIVRTFTRYGRTW